MPDAASATAGRVARDGSPYPERGAAGFDRDVRAMFAHIARGYDGFDHVASLGNDLLWRPRALWSLDRFRAGVVPRRVLDVGCGPGNLTRLVARHYGSARVIGVDFTRAMLDLARRHRTPRGRAAPDYGEGSAMTLPFRDGTFDLVVSAFVARNLPSLSGALREFRRVLAPGGTSLTLDITRPESARVRRLFLAYFGTVVPFLGSLVGSEGPYRYLPESVDALPPRGELLDLLRTSGFDRVAAVPQSGGIVTSFLGGVAPA